jgi:uncharacterized membrane protein
VHTFKLQNAGSVRKLTGLLLGGLALMVLMSWPVVAGQTSIVHGTALEGMWLWIGIYWAGLAVLFIGLSAKLKEPVLAPVAYFVSLCVLFRAWKVDFHFAPPAGWFYSALCRASFAAFILMLGLYFAYRLAKLIREQESSPLSQLPLFSQPQQWFFFIAYMLEISALAWLLHSAHITIAWSILGLLVFVFALLVGERSFRLGGLALLLLSVLKIVLMDVWQLEINDRILTLIILGLALIGVSFLYTRFSAQIRKLL